MNSTVPHTCQIDELRYLGSLDKCQVLNKLQLYTHDVSTYSVINRCKTGDTITPTSCVYNCSLFNT